MRERQKPEVKTRRELTGVIRYPRNYWRTKGPVPFNQKEVRADKF